MSVEESVDFKKYTYKKVYFYISWCLLVEFHCHLVHVSVYAIVIKEFILLRRMCMCCSYQGIYPLWFYVCWLLFRSKHVEEPSIFFFFFYIQTEADFFISLFFKSFFRTKEVFCTFTMCPFYLFCFYWTHLEFLI